MKKLEIKSEPAFRRLEAELRSRIVRGEWTSGLMLPSRKALAQEYGVNLETLQRAIAPLLDDGILRADSRRGTFVAAGNSCTVETPFANVQGETSIASVGGPSVNDLSGNSDIIKQITVGIVASSPTTTNGHQLENEWVRVILQSCERYVSHAEGSTYLFNRYRFGMPWIVLRDAVSSLLDQQVDAVIVVEPFGYSGVVDELLSVPNPRNAPIVSIFWEELDTRLPNVYYDSQLAGLQAAQHLLRTGRRPLLFIAPFAEEAEWMEERILAARKAVRQAGLPADMINVFRYAEHDTQDIAFDISDSGQVMLQSAGDHTKMPGYKSARAAFEQVPVFESNVSGRWGQWGIIAPNDEAAYGIIRAASDLGKVMGVDYAIVGFDDMPLSSMIGLTSVRPPLEALGEEAAKLVMRLLNNEQPNRQVRIRSHLLSRTSTRLQ